MTNALIDAQSALIDAECEAANLKDVLTVLSMALASETGGLDPDERSGLETVIGHACRLATEQMERLSRARGLADKVPS